MSVTKPTATPKGRGCKPSRKCFKPYKPNRTRRAFAATVRFCACCLTWGFAGAKLSADVEDVEVSRNLLWVQGKGKRERSPLTLPFVTLQALQAWLEVRPETHAPPLPLFTSFDRARKGNGRLTAEAVYLLVRRLGEQAGVKTAPHGLRHTAITEACKAAQTAGIGLEEVLDFSRHKSVSTLLVYRDRERNVQGKLAEMVAELGNRE